jgi:hypothetical protein
MAAALRGSGCANSSVGAESEINLSLGVLTLLRREVALRHRGSIQWAQR